MTSVRRGTSARRRSARVTTRPSSGARAGRRQTSSRWARTRSLWAASFFSCCCLFSSALWPSSRGPWRASPSSTDGAGTAPTTTPKQWDPWSQKLQQARTTATRPTRLLWRSRRAQARATTKRPRHGGRKESIS
eukprot:Amastigsp_a15579_3.p3 type:complete len:134 gc:universal Amastigsp_a15579_3:400-801(+)